MDAVFQTDDQILVEVIKQVRWSCYVDDNHDVISRSGTFSFRFLYSSLQYLSYFCRGYPNRFHFDFDLDDTVQCTGVGERPGDERGVE